jgi:hypothetical protein
MQTPDFPRASSAITRYRALRFLAPQFSSLGEVQSFCRGNAWVPAGPGDLTFTGRRLFRVGSEAAASGGDCRKIERYLASDKAGRLGEGAGGRFDRLLQSMASSWRRRARGGAKAEEEKALGGTLPKGNARAGL